ncbi:MAG: hypothetical protein LKF79_08375 [Solobacterium sp.]|jgi:hypothetical protein|nr:hypothetical protein [Solobacterium sp.]MCH4266642.1 hypothetical protein [Solobacterium sp.]
MKKRESRYGCDWNEVERLSKLSVEELESKVWIEYDHVDFHSDSIKRLAKLPKEELDKMVQEELVRSQIDTPRLLKEQEEVWEALWMKNVKQVSYHDSH